MESAQGLVSLSVTGFCYCSRQTTTFPTGHQDPPPAETQADDIILWA